MDDFFKYFMREDKRLRFYSSGSINSFSEGNSNSNQVQKWKIF